MALRFLHLGLIVLVVGFCLYWVTMYFKNKKGGK
jgi:hypothetical protein